MSAANKKDAEIRKFHPLFGSLLEVALQVTFRDKKPSLASLDSGTSKRDGMIYINSERSAVKFYHPAFVVGDPNGENGIEIEFQSWADTADATSWELVLRARPVRSLTRRELHFPFRVLVSGEEYTRGFNGFSGGNYLDLPISEEIDGKVCIDFKPVFLKVLKDNGRQEYFLMELDKRKFGRGRIAIKTKKIEAENVPALLREFEDF